MEEKINVELDRMLEHFNSMEKSDVIKVDPEHALKVCMGSIVANILMSTKSVL